MSDILFYYSRIKCEISHDQESLVLSLDKPLMTGYIWYFAIPRKSWTDSS